MRLDTLTKGIYRSFVLILLFNIVDQLAEKAIEPWLFIIVIFIFCAIGQFSTTEND